MPKNKTYASLLKTLPPKQSPLLTHLARGQFAQAKFALMDLSAKELSARFHASH
jgi:hypothetical protein